MHELSIAMSMIEMAGEEAARQGDARVSALHLKLGPLSGVVKEALLFSYEVASQGTPLEGSRLVIEEVPVTIYCHECEQERALDSIQRFCCPVCGTLTSDVVQGKELLVVGLELEPFGPGSADIAWSPSGQPAGGARVPDGAPMESEITQ
jgi:hydrogenase nickel incorporation protein HypA/HybF